MTAGEPSRRPPLLFIHGAFCGSWIWSEHFLPYFADAGWQCVAVSLRGHGRSGGARQLDGFGVADYVADAVEAAAGLDARPVLIGHSMGGVVSQRFVRDHGAAGLILLSSASLAGLGASFAHMALRHPDLLLALGRVQTGGMDAEDYDAIRRGLFSEDFPFDLALRYSRLFQRESLRANLELIFPQWFDLLRRPRLPALVLSGGGDCFVPYWDQVVSALLWDAELRILAGVPHALMLDTSWRLAAGAMLEWLTRTYDGSVRLAPGASSQSASSQSTLAEGT